MAACVASDTPTTVCLTSAVDSDAGGTVTIEAIDVVGVTVYPYGDGHAGPGLDVRVCPSAPDLCSVLGRVGAPVELRVCVGTRAVDEWLHATTLGLPWRWRDSLRRIVLVAPTYAADAYVQEYAATMREAAAAACPACAVTVTHDAVGA